MAKLAEAVVYLIGDQKGLKSTLDEGEKETKSWASRLGGSISNALGTALKVGLAGGVTALAGLGAAAFKVGSDFDAAYDTIRIGTGATGDALQGLQEDFKAVVKDVPTDFATASQVIADLNTRTGLTGEGLQTLSKQILELSRITGTDASANVAKATRLFGDWSIATEDQSAALDKIFRASQSTGIGVDQLMGKVVQFGPPLRQMGFSFEESAALLGKWEKEGVNAELALGSLRIAAGKFANAGVPLRQGLEEAMKAIKGTTSESEALSIAMDTFGARAGPDMAAAIREGRWAIEDYLAAIEGGADTIVGVANETADLSEKWQTTLNKLSIAIEPIANEVFGLAGSFLDSLAPAIESGVAAIVPLAQALGVALPVAIEAVKPLLEGLATVAVTLLGSVGSLADGAANLAAQLLGLGDAGEWSSSTFETLAAVARTLWERAQPLVEGLKNLARIVKDNLQPVMTGLAAIVAAVVVPAFLAWAGAAATAAAATIVALAPVLIPLAAIGAAVALLSAAWTNNWGDIQGKVSAVWAVVQPILEAIYGTLARFWTEIEPYLAAAWQNIQNIITGVWNTVWNGILQPGITALVGFWTANWGTIQSVLEGVWKVISGVVEVAWALISGIIKTGLQVLAGDWDGAWETMQETLGTVWENIQQIIDGALQIISGILELAWKAITGIAEAAWNGLAEMISRVWDDIVAGISRQIEVMKAEAGKVAQGIIDGLVNGIRNGASDVVNAIGNMLDNAVKEAKARLGIESPSKVFIEIGENIAQALILGIENYYSRVRDVIRALVDQARNAADLGSGFAGYLRATQLDPLNRQIGDTEARLKEIDKQLAENRNAEAGSLAEYDYRQQEIARLEAERQSLLDEQTANLAEQARIQEEITRLEEEQRKLAFLEQQVKLLDILKFHNLDPAQILQGVELGLGASAEGLVVAMTRALSAIIGKIDENIPQLGTGTPFWPGGAAILGDRGPELVQLPTGSRVFDAEETRGLFGRTGVTHNHIRVEAREVSLDEAGLLRTLQRAELLLGA